MRRKKLMPTHSVALKNGTSGSATFVVGVLVPLLVPVWSCETVAPGSTSQNGVEAQWVPAFDSSEVGALSGVWGSGPDDVFVVGGNESRGEVYHFDGATWREMKVPAIGLLVWVFGLGPDEVYAVGTGGGAIRFDGTAWTALDTGTTEDLWGVWGARSDELWVVGGSLGTNDPTPGKPVLMRFDGQRFEGIEPPENDRSAAALFKVWGIGSKTIAVGSTGLIIEYDDARWRQVPSGAQADEDFVALWGTAEDRIVAVGGRSGARIATYDGQSWTTRTISGVPGLNAVHMLDSRRALVGGQNGFVGIIDVENPGLVQAEAPWTALCVHSIWGIVDGVFYGVGGRFSSPYSGTAGLRFVESASVDIRSPLPLACASNAECNVDEFCMAEGECVQRQE